MDENGTSKTQDTGSKTELTSKKPRTSPNNHCTRPESMAETSEDSSPPLSNLAQDHLFSILLLLPISSILCFAMTCRKFNSLACSETLWESICRREWGQTTVDALKSTTADTGSRFSWKKLYQKIHQLDSVYCHKISTYLDDDEDVPRPRASHSLNFVSGCLVLFGGGCGGGRHLDDTWVAYIGNQAKRNLKWQKIYSGIPSGRFGHSCVVIGDSIVVFGGINDKGIRQNDTWIGQVTVQETFGIRLSWRLLDVGPVAPPPRGAHAGCCTDDKKLLIHGGIGLSGVRLGDTWILEISENLSFGVWQEIALQPSPPSRSGHTLTRIGENRTILFGGRGQGYEVLDDIWLFESSGGQFRWVKWVLDLCNIPRGLTLPRVGHSATLILGGWLLIFGGEDSYRNRKDDFWVLDVCSIPSSGLSLVNVGPKELLARMWRRIKSKGDKPSCRSFHRACTDQSGRYLYIFGGMVDGLLHPSEASGLRFDGGLYLAELAPQC